MKPNDKNYKSMWPRVIDTYVNSKQASLKMGYRHIYLVFLSVFCAHLTLVYCENETLVLLDNLAIKETHSMFFKSLKGSFC